MNRYVHDGVELPGCERTACNSSTSIGNAWRIITRSVPSVSFHLSKIFTKESVSQEYYLCRKPERTLNKCMFEKLVNFSGIVACHWRTYALPPYIRVSQRQFPGRLKARHRYMRLRSQYIKLFKSDEKNSCIDTEYNTPFSQWTVRSYT